MLHLQDSESDRDGLPQETRLVQQAKAGDREAFGRLTEMHAVRVYRIAYATLRNQQEAEDAVQDAFVTAFKSIKKLEKDESFGSWLTRIVTTRVYDIIRQKQRKQKSVESQTTALKIQITLSASNPANGKTELALDLQEAIAKLPDLHRLAITLRYVEDASTDDIAATLKRPAGTIRRILSESYRMLRLHLEGQEREGDDF